MVGFTFVLPFLPLFIKQDLGVHPLAAVELWAGVGATSTAICVALFSPIWGALADRTGRRLMVIRAMIAGGLAVALMAAVTNVYQLVGLRIAQGIFTGTIAASTALVATSVPRTRIGFALGLLQTSIYVGISGGPLLGGLTAQAVGRRPTFLLAGLLLVTAGLLVFFLVTEHFDPARRPTGESAWRRLRAAAGQRDLQALLVVLFLVQLSTSVVFPILPLYVEALAGPGQPVSSLSGLVFGVTAGTNAVAAIVYSRLADRRGYRPVLIWCALGVTLMFAAQSLVQHPYQLILLRAGQGMFFGGIIPATNAIVGLTARPGQQGSSYGVTASATALGQATGPLLGASLAALAGLRAVFVVSASAMALLAVWIMVRVREPVQSGRST
jgi:DHA1 family multidrug resistance protein-like MFS transporter